MADKPKPRGILILLHGRGDTSTGFARGISGLADLLLPIDFELVLPTSAIRYSSVFEQDISEWFDIYSLKEPDAKQETQLLGLRESIQQIFSVIEEEVKRVDGDYKRIFLGGISQGMAVASLAFLLLEPHKLGGFVGTNGWMPLYNELERAMEASLDVRKVIQDKLGLVQDGGSGEQGKPRVFLGHGRDDMVIDIELGRKAREVFEKCGYEVIWKEYEGALPFGHWFKWPEEFEDVVAFLKKAVKD